jgi:hypothetical protein
MKYALFAPVLAVAKIAVALDGQIGIHDHSTVVLCDGKYYTYGTGGSSLVSDDGWPWRPGTALPRRGLAPDVIHFGNRYCVYVAANIGAQPKAVNMIWSKTLDPNSPEYKWEEGGVVGLVRSRRRFQCHRSRGISGSDKRQAVVDLWLLFRIHPAGRTRSQDGQAHALCTPHGCPFSFLRGGYYDPGAPYNLIDVSELLWSWGVSKNLSVHFPLGSRRKGWGRSVSRFRVCQNRQFLIDDLPVTRSID